MTPELSTLCSRVALEESRPAAWTRAKQLREECAQRLKLEPPEQVHAWLLQLINTAMHAQVRARGTTPKGN